MFLAACPLRLSVVKGRHASEARSGPRHNKALIYKICVLATARETAYASRRLCRAQTTAAERAFFTSHSAAGMTEDARSTNQCCTGI